MRCAVLALALLLVALPARAQETPPDSTQTTPVAATPIVRTALDPKEGAVVGQHMSLFVDVLFPGDMPHPPRVAIPDLAGAQVMRFETQATTIRDTIDGAPFVGQRFEFAVFPRRGGPLTIPPATVTLLDRAGDVTGTLTGQPAQETIIVPDGIDADTVVVATEKLTLDQSWKPDPKGPFHAGDALVRTITRTAQDIPALAMRDLRFDAPDGVRVYVDDPVSQDQSERGTITGKRVDRATYVFEKPGSVDLPEVTQPWWNLADKQVETATGAAAAITVAPGPVAASTAGSATGIGPVRPAVWVTAAAIAILAVLLVATAWRKLRVRRARRRTEWALSEPAAFEAMTKACQGDDPGTTYRALAAWRSRLPASWPPPPSTALETALFSGAAPEAWSRADAQALLETLRRFRNGIAKSSHAGRPMPLPPLNPA